MQRVLTGLSVLAVVVASSAALAQRDVRPRVPTGTIAPASTGVIVVPNGAGAGALGGAAPPATANAPGATSTAPPVPGWPHDIRFGKTEGCARNPFPLEVIVYEDPNFTGKCSILMPGFYPRDFQLLVRNDSISAIKVGQLVRARAFKNGEYGGAFTTYGASSTIPKLTSDWNDSISSMRVEMANRSQSCDDVRDGEVGLYESENFSGDCVVLPADGSYATGAQMGIENDSISSIWNNSSKELIAYNSASFNSMHGIRVPPRTKIAELGKDGGNWLFGTEGINDNISSFVMR